jgi:hypothetical protein
MYSIRFQTTSDARLPPPDLPAHYTWDRLSDLLSREIGPEAARLLAEPVVDASRVETHWHVTADNDPVPLAKLDPEKRTELLGKLEAIRAKAKARAAELEASSGENAARQAAALRLITSFPGESCVWSVEGEPVLTCWGRSPLGENPRLRQIAGVAASRRTAANAGAPTARGEAASASPSAVTLGQPAASTIEIFSHDRRARRLGWLGGLAMWLAFALLMAICYVKLLAACGIALPGQPGFCLAGGPSDRAKLERQNEELRDALRGKEARIAALGPCTPAPSPTGGVDPNEVEKRRNEAGVARGRLDITLAWNSHADLDLHVVCPGGEISFSSRTECGGALDHDANGGSTRLEDRPVEHVSWTSDPPAGHYRVVVVLYDFRDISPEPVPFTVVVRDADTERSYQGVVAAKGERVSPVEFNR